MHIALQAFFGVCAASAGEYPLEATFACMILPCFREIFLPSSATPYFNIASAHSKLLLHANKLLPVASSCCVEQIHCLKEGGAKAETAPEISTVLKVKMIALLLWTTILLPRH